MPEDKKERQYIALSSILPYDHFRTVESFDMAKAKIEMKAEIGLKAPFMDRLEFRLPWDGALLGYVRRTKALDDLCRGEGVDPERAVFCMNDWDDRFLMVLDDEPGKKNFSFYVTPEEMKTLLEKCCRIPAQRELKINERK